MLKSWVGGRRATYGDYFGIGVAGYPEAHPDTITDDPAENEANYQKDLAYLKEKVRAPVFPPLPMARKTPMDAVTDGCLWV